MMAIHTSDLSWEKMVHLRSDVSLLVFIRTSVKRRIKKKSHKIISNGKYTNDMYKTDLHAGKQIKMTEGTYFKTQVLCQV